MKEESSYSSGSSSSSEEDDDAVLLTDKVEQKLLTVVAKLRNKDPEMYGIDKPIFEDDDFQQTKEKVKKSKVNDNIDEDAGNYMESESGSEEMDEIQVKEKLKAKLKNTDDDDMFKIKKKALKPQQGQKNKVEEYLSGMKEGSQALEKLWLAPGKMDETDHFLQQYILDKKWVNSKVQPQAEAMIDEEDEERSVQMDEYEARYNFRYEEPGGSTIKQFPREIPQSVRLKPESRKQKRQKLAERKKAEQQQLVEQAQQMKRLKKAEIIAKMAEKAQEADAEEEVMQESEEDFEHDWFFCDDCAKAFEEGEAHFVCPECDEYMLCQECHDLIIHKHEMKKAVIPKGFGPPPSQVAEKALSKLTSCRDCRKKLPEYLQRYEWKDKTYLTVYLCSKCYDQSNLQTKKKFKIVKGKGTEDIEQMLQKQPERIKELTCSKDIQQLVDEYMKCDFEDVLTGGLKTKFRYVKVKPESYGLSDEQILFGEDKELNKYVSIRKLAPYNEDEMKLRNSFYNQKVVGIDRSVRENRALMKAKGGKVVRNIQKVKNRAEIMRKRREGLKRKLKMVNLSNPDKEREHFLPKSRLESYGLTQ